MSPRNSVLFTSFLLLIAGASLASTENTELLGWWDGGGRGEATAVAVDAGASLVVFNEGRHLKVLSVADPSDPQLLGHLALPDWIRGIALSGSHAYVAVSGAGLRIVDLSDPSTPVEVGFLDTPGWASGVAVAAGYAYVADGDAGLRVINVLTPSAPVETGAYDTPGSAIDVVIVGNRAYVADGDAGLRVVDVSNPTAPFEAGAHDTPGVAYGIAVEGNHAFVADYGSGLRIVNVSDAENLQEVAVHELVQGALGVTISGALAFVADENRGLRIIDVSDPNHPGSVGGYASRNDGTEWNILTGGIAVSLGNAWVASEAGLQVIDISDPAGPVEVGSAQALPYGLSDIATDGVYVYASAYGAGFRIMDATDPSSPTWIETFATSGDPRDVTVAGNYAYVVVYSDTTQEASVEIFDVADPEDASSVGLLEGGFSGWCQTDVEGGLLYVADETWGLRIFSLVDPTTPTQIGFFPTAAYDVEVAGSYAYLACREAGMLVIDVSNPAEPALAATYDSPGSVSEIALGDGLACLSEGEGVRVVDISDPLAPSEIGLYRLAATGAPRVSIIGDHAYLSDFASGLRILDVSSSGDPVEVAAYGIIYAEDIAVGGGHAYLPSRDDHFHLHVVNVSDLAGPLQVGSAHTPGETRSVVVAGDQASIADGHGGFGILDVTDAAAAAPVGQTDLPCFAQDLAVAGDFAYLIDTCQRRFLSVVDASIPSDPQVVGQVETPWSVNDLAAAPPYVYVVSTWPAGLSVFDVQDPEEPQFLATLEIPYDGRAVTVWGNHAYVAAEFALIIVDVSVPTAPSVVGGVHRWYMDSVAVDDGRAYLGGCHSDIGAYGLAVFDVATPSDPFLIGFLPFEVGESCFDLTSRFDGLDVVDGYAYLTDVSTGLRVVDVVDPSNLVEVAVYDDLPSTASLQDISVVGTAAHLACECDGLAIIDVDLDADDDGWLDNADNCPDDANSEQADGDEDGSGLACDCNDANPSVHPGAEELNDGLDNQCPGELGHGVIDESTGISGFNTPDDTSEYSWPAQSGATLYEVVRSTTPDFSSSCTFLTTSDTAIPTEVPPPGTAHHYLSRPIYPHLGSWGQNFSGQERSLVCSDEIAAINFQPYVSEVPEGFSKDWGQPFDPGLGHGWDASIPGKTRERNFLVDQVLNTFIRTLAVERWNLVLPDGVYVVWVTSGDPSYDQGPHQIVIEDLTVVAGATTDAGSFLVTAACVSVADGDLTIVIGGLAGKTVLNSVRVETDSCTPGTILEQEIVTP